MVNVGAPTHELRPSLPVFYRVPQRERPSLAGYLWSSPGIACITVAYFVLASEHPSPLIVNPFQMTATELGIILVGAVVIGNNLAKSPRIDRYELAVAGVLSLLVAFPFAHLPHVRFTSYLVTAIVPAMALSAFRFQPNAKQPRGRVLVVALFTLLAVTSALSPDAGALKQAITITSIVVSVFFLAGRLDENRQHATAITFVALAAAESVLAIVEPFVFPRHLWGAAQVDGTGAVVPLKNSLLPSFERSQGTLGHPIPLGLLLVVALALLIRILYDLPRSTKLALGALLLGGLLFTGDRNSFIEAFFVLLVGRGFNFQRLFAGLAIGLLAVVGAITAGRLNASLVTNFLASGSYLHRVSAFSSVPKLLFTQRLPGTLFGNGIASTERMFQSGRLQTDGFNVVDNEFVSIQSQGGILCLILIALLVVLAIAACQRQLRPAVLVVVSIMFVFDSLLWPSAAAITFLVLGLALVPRAAGNAPGPPRRVRY